MAYVTVSHEGDELQGTPAIRKLISAETGNGTPFYPEYIAWVLPLPGSLHRLQLWFSQQVEELQEEIRQCGRIILTFESVLQGRMATEFREIQIDETASGPKRDNLFLIAFRSESAGLTPAPTE